VGLILDTSILIEAERRGQRVEDFLARSTEPTETAAAISAVSVVEMTHGIYRAKNEVARERRRTYTRELYRVLQVHPVSLEIALLAGKIEGQEAAHGNLLAFEDLLIGRRLFISDLV
jgi:tRNA(fMet)-specific endonuclease VapC